MANRFYGFKYGCLLAAIVCGMTTVVQHASAIEIGFEASEGYAAEKNVAGLPANAADKWAGDLGPKNQFFVTPDGSGQIVTTKAGTHSFTTIRIQPKDLGITDGSTLNTKKISYSVDVRINDKLEPEVNFTALTNLRIRIGNREGNKSAGNFELSSAGYLRFSDGKQNGIKVKSATGSIDVAKAGEFITVSGEIDFAKSTYTLFVNDVQQSNKNKTEFTFELPEGDLFFSLRQITNAKVEDPKTKEVAAGNASFSIDNIKLKVLP